MITSFEVEQLLAWMELLTRQYEQFSLDEIALAEGVHLVFEPIQETYSLETIDSVKVLIVNSLFTEEQKRRTVIGALAAERASEGKELLIRVSTN